MIMDLLQLSVRDNQSEYNDFPESREKTLQTRQPQLQDLSSLQDSYINEGKLAKPPGGRWPCSSTNRNN